MRACEPRRVLNQREVLVVLADHLRLAGDRVHDGLGADRAQRRVRRPPPPRVDGAGEGAHAEHRQLLDRGRPGRLAWGRQLGHRTAALAPPPEQRHHVVVGGHLRLVGHLGRVGRAHQHPVQRRGQRVLGRRPPADDLGLGAGEGDVQQAQPLAGVLLLRAADVVGPPRSATADVHAAAALVVVEPRPLRLRDVAVGDGGQVDDGVLEALARVDRHQLDGGRVAVETAGALQATAGAALGHLLAQPGQQRDQPVPLGEGGLVQGLADVAQVGQPAVAAHLGQHPGRQPGDARGLHHGRQPTAAEQLQPRPQRLGHLVGEVVAARVEVGGGVPEEAGQRGRAHPGAAMRLLEGLQQRQPLDGRRGGEHAAAARDHAGDTDLLERGLGVGEVGVAIADHRDVAGPHRPPVERRALVEQAAYVVGEVARDPRAHLPHCQQPGPARHVLPTDHAHPERMTRPDQPTLGVMRLDVADHDPFVAERGAAEQLLQRRVQHCVAAPVHRQGLLGRRGGGRGEVGRDVAAAEGVDGLLGVADQHHRGVPAERPVEHLPLHRVGVLELVDQHDPPPLPHPVGCRRLLLLERVRELAEEVVVGQHAEASLAAVHLLAHRAREADPSAGRRGAVLRLRLEVGLGVVDDAAGDRERDVVGERRPRLVEREGPQVQVVDDLLDQVVEVLDQPGS